MFEALLTLCLDASAGPCRDLLLPGFEAPTQAECEALSSGIEGARCLPVGVTLDLEELAPGVFVHVGQIDEPDAQNGGDVANIGFVVGTRSVAVMDCGSAAWIGEGLWRAIRARTDLPVSHVIVTHMHPDHALGCTPFIAAGAEVVGHERLPRALADRRENYRESLSRLIGPGRFLGSDTPKVARTVATETPVDLGDRTLTLRPWPNAHTGTDLTVQDEATGLMFTGDLLFDTHTPALDGSLRGWQAVLSDLTALPATGVIPGHGGPLLPWPDGAAPLRRYLVVLAEDTRRAIDAGERLGDAVQHIAASEAPHWALFEAYNPRNATVAFTELEWE
ncbi:quinoprotein relay system zinc metallohydrolase 2 [Tropicibacter sp. S64]|uniref:quinoprotein relay system zinc metallohydrolase 2 n=1 Tax=Tropicibacter sp. S64 TaxID=3415122 RepID=UPI003C7E7F4E